MKTLKDLKDEIQNFIDQTPLIKKEEWNTELMQLIAKRNAIHTCEQLVRDRIKELKKSGYQRGWDTAKELEHLLGDVEASEKK